jgi:hypothetical protein
LLWLFDGRILKLGGGGRNLDTTAVAVSQLEAGEPIGKLSNDALIVELLQTLNHLSRWLTPIHNQTLLEISPRRSEPSVKEHLLALRDLEARVFSMLYAIVNASNPDLDRIPRAERTLLQVEADQRAKPLVVMSEFRRVRESSTSLLRALPDNAWDRKGYSRTERDWSVRELAEFLAENDRRTLRDIDRMLDWQGVRRGIAAASRVRFDAIERPFISVATKQQ